MTLKIWCSKNLNPEAAGWVCTCIPSKSTILKFQFSPGTLPYHIYKGVHFISFEGQLILSNLLGWKWWRSRATTNRKFLDLHRNSITKKPVFQAMNPYSYGEERPIFLLNDATHQIKSMRNAISSKKRMLWVSFQIETILFAHTAAYPIFFQELNSRS